MSNSFPLQRVWQPVGPILVAWSTIETEFSGDQRRVLLKTKVWYQVLETTRHMRAHPNLVDGDDLVEVILGNLRA